MTIISDCVHSRLMNNAIAEFNRRLNYPCSRHAKPPSQLAISQTSRSICDVHVPQDSTFPLATNAVCTVWLFKILYVAVVFSVNNFQWESRTLIITLSLRDFSSKRSFFYLAIILLNKTFGLVVFLNWNFNNFLLIRIKHVVFWSGHPTEGIII